MAKTSIVFFGAGPVASESLSQLLDNFIIEAVITKPKLEKHTAPVIDIALQHGLPTFTPSSRLELTEIFKNQEFLSQVGVVIDFGIIIAADVFDSFEYGIVNSHFSLLPEWRGADPITFSILSGQKTTGVSLMRIVEELDEGPIIAQQEMEIPADYNVHQLTADLIKLSSKLLNENLQKYLDGGIKLIDQDVISKTNNRAVSYSKKIHKSEGLIDWGTPAEALERQIRAFIGWPQSRCTLGSIDLIITEAKVAKISLSVGKHLVSNKNLFVGCGNNSSLSIQKLKPIGKNEMSIASFLAGYSSKLGD